MRFHRSGVPDFLDLKGHGHSQDRENVRRVTEGDPSKFKLNHVMITDETVRQIDDCLRQRSYGLEYLKVFSGSYGDRKPDMPEIIEASRAHGVIPYVGGGMTEKAMRDRSLFRYSKELQDLGIDTIEVSNSYGDLPVSEERAEIARLTKDFRRVLIEIGSKSGKVLTTREAWLEDLDTALELDASAIILEGTGSGRSGIYDARGRSNGVLVSELQQRAGEKSDRFLVEAPFEHQRDFWVKQLFGWNVRLGNIPLDSHTLQGIDRLRLDAMPEASAQAVTSHRETQGLFRDTVIKICEEEGLDPNSAIFHPSVHSVTAQILNQDAGWEAELRQFICGLHPSRQFAYGQPMYIRVPVGQMMSMEDLLRIMFGG